MEEFIVRIQTTENYGDFPWLFMMFISTTAYVLMGIVSLIGIAIFNPSGLKDKLRDSVKLIGWVMFMPGFSLLAYILQKLGVPFPGVVTFYLVVIAAMLADWVQGLRRDERNQKQADKAKP